MKRVYHNDVEQIDLMVGTHAESIRPDGFGFGETQFQIFILMASRRLQADRFYTDYYRKEVYSEEGLRWIDEASMKKVLLRHIPELAPALKRIKTAFNPWNEAK